MVSRETKKNIGNIEFIYWQVEMKLRYKKMYHVADMA